LYDSYYCIYCLYYNYIYCCYYWSC